MTRRHLLPLLVFLCLGASALTPAWAGAAPADNREPQAVSKIDYPGAGIQVARQSGDHRKLKGTPRSFKRFVRARLDVLFEEAGSGPQCATSPTIFVDRYQSNGWASAREGSYGECFRESYAVIYDRTTSGWRRILAERDFQYCQDLAWYGVPRFIGGDKCLSEEFVPVRYNSNDDTIASPEATVRRVMNIVGGAPAIPESRVILPAALAQLRALADSGVVDGGGECVTAGDDHPWAAHLGEAPYGCVIGVYYGMEVDHLYMLRMDADGDDVLVTELYKFA